jgi:PAS domain S-box-containing protein
MTESREGNFFDRKPRHWLIWFTLLASTLIFYPWALSSSWTSSSDVHALFEFWSAFVALTAGLVIMIHYFANGSWLFLIISLGFVLQGGEDVVHAIFAFSRIWGKEQHDIIKFVPATYAMGRFVLGACILTGWFMRGRYTDAAKRGKISFLVYIAGIAFSIFSTFLIINFHFPLPSFIRPGNIIIRPFDFLVALFYIPIIALYIKEFGIKQHHTRFVFSIICSLIYGIAAQIYMVRSRGLYDAQFDMAHIMKIFSYLFPILGISFGTFRMYKKEAEHRKALALAMQKEKQLSAAATAAAEAEKEKAQELAVAMHQVYASQQQLSVAYEQVASNEKKLKVANQQLTIKEQALREAQKGLEKKYHLIVGTATEGIWTLGPDAMTTYVNARMAEMLGYRSEEMIGRPVTDFMFEEDAPDHWQKIENRKRGLAENYERRFRRNDGQAVWTTASATPLLDEKGQFGGTFAMFTDITERKRAEEALRESEVKHRIVANNTYDWEFWLSQEDELIYISPSCKRITGYAPDQFIVDPGLWERIVHPDDRSHFADHYHEVKRLRSGLLEYRIVRSDGDIRWIEHACQPVFDDKENFLGTRGSNRDITDRKQAEEHLAERVMLAELSADIGSAVSRQDNLHNMLQECSEALVRHLEAAFARIWILNPVANVLELQASAGMYTRIDGSHARVPVGNGNIGMIALNRKPHVTNSIVEDGFDQDQEWAIGKELTAFAGHPLTINDKLVGVMALFSRKPLADATLNALAAVANGIALGIERKQTENALRESDAFIKNILESVNEGFIVLDRSFNILLCNSAYQQLFDVTTQSLAEKHCYEISRHLDRPCYECGEDCAPYNTFMTGEPQTACHKRTVAGGKSAILEVKSYPMKNEAGNVVSVIVILTDVTEKNMLEQQLHQSQKMEAIGTLAGGVAHDFNNILMAIMGFSELAKMDMPPNDPHLQHIEHIISSAQRAANLTRGLLAFSRKQVIEPRPLNLNDIVQNVEKLLRRLIGEDIVFTTRLTSRTLIAMADPGQIEQVLMNLSTNARDALPGGGTITISTEEVELDGDFVSAHELEQVGRYALLSVSDTGAGMDEQTREKIFEPFFTTKQVGKGTGLGLSIVYGIIKQHNGYISCSSTLGSGTTFNIYLPIITLRANIGRSEVQRQALGGTETILFAEDDQNVRNLVIGYLRSSGYHVIDAADGQEAIDQFAKHEKEIDLLLLDVIMPKKSGKAVYDFVKATHPEIKALFMSGYAADDINKNGLFEEGLHFVSKPVTSFDLLSKIRGILDKKGEQNDQVTEQR